MKGESGVGGRRSAPGMCSLSDSNGDVAGRREKVPHIGPNSGIGPVSLSSIKLEFDGELDGDETTTTGHMLGGSNWGGIDDQRKRQLYMKASAAPIRHDKRILWLPHVKMLCVTRLLLFIYGQHAKEQV